MRSGRYGPDNTRFYCGLSKGGLCSLSTSIGFPVVTSGAIRGLLAWITIILSAPGPAGAYHQCSAFGGDFLNLGHIEYSR